MSIAAMFHQHHVRCDQHYVAAEDAVADRQWESADHALAAFLGETEAHFRCEEEDLFTAFENATGTAMGPTRVMRFEHAQMRELFTQMRAALANRNADGYADAAETLLVLMQQHNMKEENILYPMCDRLLPVDAMGAALRQRLETSCRA